MDKTQFTKVISALRDQNDKDVLQAEKLSTIYGSDINPNDNRLLTDAIFEILDNKYPNSKDDIHFFCYEQDFGRKSNKSISELWNDVVRNIDVMEPIILSKPYSRFTDNDAFGHP